MVKSGKLNRVVKGRGHNRWKKGHSSDCNPTAKGFREKAKQFAMNRIRFGEEATTSAGPMVVDDDVQAKDSASVAHSYVSNISGLTNVSVSKLCFSLDPMTSDLHRNVIALIAALADSIEQLNATDSEVAYFSAALNLISSTTLTDDSSLNDIEPLLFLLSFLIKKVPSNLVVKHSSNLVSFACRASEVFPSSQAIQTAMVVIYGNVLKHAGKFDPNLLASILKHSVDDSNPHLRRKAAKMTQICCHNKPRSSLTAAVAEFVKEGLNDAVKARKNVVAYLTLTKMCLPYCGQNDIKEVIEIVFSLITVSNSVIKLSCYQLINHIFTFQHQSMSASLTTRLSEQIAAALYDFQPPVNDLSSMREWIQSLYNIHRHLHDSSPLAFDVVLRLASRLLECFHSSHSIVRDLVSFSLIGLYEKCVTSDAERCIYLREIREYLSFQYLNAWPQVFKTLSQILTSTPNAVESLASEAAELLVQLGELKNSQDFSKVANLDSLLGILIRVFGAEFVTDRLPLNLPALDLTNSWLLPLMRDNIRSDRIAYFVAYFLPMSQELRHRQVALRSEASRSLSKSIYSQIWSLLPAFASAPRDPLKFKIIAKLIGDELPVNGEIRGSLLMTLKNMSISHPEMMTSFAKNYFPILFNIYSDTKTDKPTRATLLDCLRFYSRIIDNQMKKSLVEKLLHKIVSFDVEAEAGRGKVYLFFDLLLLLIGGIDAEAMASLASYLKPFITSPDRRLQKKGYRLIEAICKSDNEICQQFVSENIGALKELLLLSSVASVAPPSRKSRLRCLSIFIPQLSAEQLTSLLPETILCFNEANKAAKLAAKHVFKLILEALLAKEKPAIVLECLMRIIGEMAESGDAVKMRCALIAAGSLTTIYRDQISPAIVSRLLSITSALVKRAKSGPAPSSTLKPVIGFHMKLVSNLRADLLEECVGGLVGEVARVPFESRRSIRFDFKLLLMKLMRKVDYNAVKAHLTPELQKQLALIRKCTLRSKKERRDKADGGSCVSTRTRYEDMSAILRDSDDEDEAAESRVSKRGKAASRLYAVENDEPLDLADPNSLRKVVLKDSANAAEGVEGKKKRQEIKFSSDGRLLIEEEAALEVADDGDEEEDSDNDMDVVTMVSKSRRSKLSKQQQPSNAPITIGQEYSSKKAAGDVRKANAPDPYAYVKLNPKSLNRRKQQKYRGQFKNIVGGARRGAAKGSKQRKQQQNKK